MGDFEARGMDGVGRLQGAALERALEWGPEPARREMPPGIVVRVVAAPSSSWCPVVSYKKLLLLTETINFILSPRSVYTTRLRTSG